MYFYKYKTVKILSLIFILFAIIFTDCKCKTSKNSFKIESGGIERTYEIYIPSSIKEKTSLPLVIILHGGGGTGKNMIKLTNFNTLAEKEGFMAVYPDGYKKHWNDGRNLEGWESHKENIDDVGFISILIDELVKKYNADKSRVYVTGISNGGLMSYRLGLELPEKITAIAPVTANLGENLYKKHKSSKPISVLIMNGTGDPLVPYNGGDIHFYRKKLGKVISTEDTVKFWVNNNKCNTKPDITMEPDKAPEDGTSVKKEVYKNGKNETEVILYTIEGGGHTWPGGYQYLPEKIVGKTSKDINATETIWNFFKTHRLYTK